MPETTLPVKPKVWCSTCQHGHIPGIPVVTWKCDDCGFGAWDDRTAMVHAVRLPDHHVAFVVHRVEVAATQSGVAGPAAEGDKNA